VRSSGRSLLAIINDILDFTRGSSHKRRLHDSEFRPAAEIESVIELFAESSERSERSWISKPVLQSALFDCIAAATQDAGAEAGKQISHDSTRRFLPATSLSQLSSAVPAEIRARTRILSVEDHPVNQRVVLKMLERLGYHGDGVSNGAEAVEALRSRDYDIILMDCLMPEMDGYAATRAIRSEFQGSRRVTIIGVTANALHGDRQRCLDAGMNDYLSKPLLAEALAETLTRWLMLNGPGGFIRAAPPPVSPSVPTIDMRAISEFAEAGESGEEFIANIIEVFLADMTERVRTLGLQMGHHDTAGLAATAHAIKGSCAHFGATHLMHLCVAVEEQEKSEDRRNRCGGQFNDRGDGTGPCRAESISRQSRQPA
jgi:CheY-like chemotaxis protein/HPt (histidine-containing phosphotransfer) domain-containing protein